MRIGLITKLWGRRAVTLAMMSYYGSLGLDIVGACAYTNERDLPTACQWRRVKVANKPFSDGWNAACRLLANSGVDVAFVIGSDDLLSVDYIEAACRLIRDRRADFIEPTVLYNYCAETGRVERVEADRFGAGVVMSARLLERCRWIPWQPGKQNNDRALCKYAGLVCDASYVWTENPPMLALKTAQTLVPWGSDRFCRNRRALTESDVGELLSSFFGVTHATFETLRLAPDGHQRDSA